MSLLERFAEPTFAKDQFIRPSARALGAALVAFNMMLGDARGKRLLVVLSIPVGFIYAVAVAMQAYYPGFALLLAVCFLVVYASIVFQTLSTYDAAFNVPPAGANGQPALA
jgi:Trk-type K+ transport system membrane component